MYLWESVWKWLKVYESIKWFFFLHLIHEKPQSHILFFNPKPLRQILVNVLYCSHSAKAASVGQHPLQWGSGRWHITWSKEPRASIKDFNLTSPSKKSLILIPVTILTHGTCHVWAYGLLVCDHDLWHSLSISSTSSMSFCTVCLWSTKRVDNWTSDKVPSKRIMHSFELLKTWKRTS